MTDDGLQYFRDRLADAFLVDQAVVVPGASDVAVPVGGRRRGGFVPVDDDLAAVGLRYLQGFEGFPDLRVVPGDDEVCTVIEWGGTAPSLPDMDADDGAWIAFDRACGEYFGYSEQAIVEYLTATHGPAVQEGARRSSHA